MTYRIPSLDVSRLRNLAEELLDHLDRDDLDEAVDCASLLYRLALKARDEAKEPR
jgi:hypothetical protein